MVKPTFLNDPKVVKWLLTERSIKIEDFMNEIRRWSTVLANFNSIHEMDTICYVDTKFSLGNFSNLGFKEQKKHLIQSLKSTRL